MVSKYFPKAFLYLTILCIVYAAYLALRVYLARDDEEKKSEKLRMAKKGAVTVVIMYAALLVLKLIFNWVLNFFGVIL